MILYDIIDIIISLQNQHWNENMAPGCSNSARSSQLLLKQPLIAVLVKFLTSSLSRALAERHWDLWEPFDKKSSVFYGFFLFQETSKLQRGWGKSPTACVFSTFLWWSQEYISYMTCIGCIGPGLLLAPCIFIEFCNISRICEGETNRSLPKNKPRTSECCSEYIETVIILEMSSSFESPRNSSRADSVSSDFRACWSTLIWDPVHEISYANIVC